MIKQISVFLENKEGRLESVLKILDDHKINMRSLTIAETADYGILRLVVDDPELCMEKLREENFIVRETPVLALGIEDVPGAMLKVIQALAESHINIEYTYSCLPGKKSSVIIIIRVNDNQKASEVLKNTEGVKLLSWEDIL